MQEDRNQSQIIRKDAKNCFVESLSDAFDKGKAHFAFATYDVNKDNVADLCVLPGTEVTRVGAGVEYFPIEGSRDIRFHGGYSYAWGTNGNLAGGTVWGDQSFLTLGVTWKMSILNR